MIRYSILAIPLVLAACAQPSVAVQNDVAATEIALTAAEKLALHYTTLPRCPAAMLCSDPSVVAKIKDLDNKAYNAVMLARHNEGPLSAAIEAVTAFRNVIPGA